MWEGVGDWTELQHIDPHSIGHNRISFPFSWAAQPGAWRSSLSGTCSSFQLLLSNLSELQLLNQGLRAPSAGLWFSRPHLISNCLKLPMHRVILLFYAHSISSHNWPMEYATSAVFGMACFDHHQAEITVMQFTGHPLPVHQFVTVPRDFNPIPYCQPSSPNITTEKVFDYSSSNLALCQNWHNPINFEEVLVVIFIILGDGHGDQSSNPGQAVCISDCINTLGNYSPSSYGLIVGQTQLFNPCMATDLKEGKLWIQTC